jgi:hypothetical protein
MAHNDSRRFTFPSVDRAPTRASFDAAAESWRTFASVAVASTLVIAACVSAFALLDAVIATTPSLQAGRAPARAAKSTQAAPVVNGMPTRRACVLPDDKFVTAPMQVDPALFVTE